MKPLRTGLKAWLGVKLLKAGTRWAWKGLWMAGLVAAAKGLAKRRAAN